MRATRWAVGAVAVLAAAGAFAAAPAPAPRADGRDGLVVHEWGTFSSFSGSDGVPLRFYPANTDLPPFVHRGESNRKDSYSGPVSLETPVLYFYSDRPLTASVRAEFPTGAFTEWYPRADRRRESTLVWDEVRVRPDGPVRLPAAPGEDRYYAAREAGAAPLVVAPPAGQKGRPEQEGFLFYRGVGSPRTPLAVKAQGGGAFTLRADGRDPVPAAVLVEVRAGAVRFRDLGPVSGGGVEATLPDGGSDPARLRDLLTATLTRAGLFEKEARAMVKTWERAWLGDEGTRVLYVLPPAWADRALPLRVTPKPDTLVRVMVGRHDLLTPEREREVDLLVGKLKGPEAGRKAAEAELERLGRFAGPARQRAEKRLTDRGKAAPRD